VTMRPAKRAEEEPDHPTPSGDDAAREAGTADGALSAVRYVTDASHV